MSETRTMAATATKTASAEGDAAAAKGGKKRLMIITIAVVLIAAVGAFYYLHAHGSSSSTSKKKVVPAPVAGAVLDVDPVSINLADGHYLKIGISLQETKGAKDVTSGSEALDATIDLYSGQTMATLQDKTKAAALKAQLVKTIAKDYDDQVYDVYFTEYVMQ